MTDKNDKKQNEQFVINSKHVRNKSEHKLIPNQIQQNILNNSMQNN